MAWQAFRNGNWLSTNLHRTETTHPLVFGQDDDIDADDVVYDVDDVATSVWNAQGEQPRMTNADDE